jgi:hypothetical protein
MNSPEKLRVGADRHWTNSGRALNFARGKPPERAQESAKQRRNRTEESLPRRYAREQLGPTHGLLYANLQRREKPAAGAGIENRPARTKNEQRPGRRHNLRAGGADQQNKTGGGELQWRKTESVGELTAGTKGFEREC